MHLKYFKSCFLCLFSNFVAVTMLQVYWIFSGTSKRLRTGLPGVSPQLTMFTRNVYIFWRMNSTQRARAGTAVAQIATQGGAYLRALAFAYLFVVLHLCFVLSGITNIFLVSGTSRTHQALVVIIKRCSSFVARKKEAKQEHNSASNTECTCFAAIIAFLIDSGLILGIHWLLASG